MGRLNYRCNEKIVWLPTALRWVRDECLCRCATIARTFLPLTPRPEAVAALASVLVGTALLVIKFVAYFKTGSAAIFSDAMESIVNVLASGFAVYAIYYAHRPADREHPYGHGKIEFMSAGFEGGMIFVAALVIAYHAIEAMLLKPQLHDMTLGLLLMAGAMVINGGMGVYLIRSGKTNGSVTLEADGKHLFADAITGAATIVGADARPHDGLGDHRSDHRPVDRRIHHDHGSRSHAIRRRRFARSAGSG